MATETPSKNISNKLRIAIIGAGIGGLALAASLTRIIPEGDVIVDVYEQSPEIKEIGAGIFFWPRTWKVLETLGLAEDFEKLLEKKPDTGRRLQMKMIKGDQGKAVHMMDVYRNGSGTPFHRALVQKTLLDSLPPSVNVHLSHRLISYDELDDKVILNFDGKPVKECSLLVGADGIRSQVRGQFISKRLPDQVASINPVWSGTVVHRSLVDADKIREVFPDHVSLHTPTLFIGDGKYMATYPILKGRVINVGAQVTNYSQDGTTYEGQKKEVVDKEKILSLFSGWSEECVVLLQNLSTTSLWAIEYVNPLRSFAVGRVALLGDAAHAMPPTQGSGAGQAIEDGYTLAHLLRKAIKENVPIHHVTEVYSNTRQPLANLVLQRSLDAAKLISFRAPGFEGINDVDDETQQQLYAKFPQVYDEMYDWMDNYSVEKEIEKALSML